MKPKANATKYIETGGVGCPRCGSHDIEGGSVSIDQGIAYQHVWCTNPECLLNWTDQYTLTSIDNVYTDDEPDKVIELY